MKQQPKEKTKIELMIEPTVQEAIDNKLISIPKLYPESFGVVKLLKELPDADTFFYSIQSYETAFHLNCSYQKTKTNLSLIGPPGSGKTLTVAYVCMKNQLPMTRINITAHMEASDLLGRMVVKVDENGHTYTVYELGPLALAMMVKNNVILLDEFDQAPVGIQMIFQPILENGDNPLTLAEGGVSILPAPGIKFVATSNTSGNGDTEGNYSGAQVMHSALLQRFPAKIMFDYISSQEEALILNGVWENTSKDFKSQMVNHILEFPVFKNWVLDSDFNYFDVIKNPEVKSAALAQYYDEQNAYLAKMEEESKGIPEEESNDYRLLEKIFAITHYNFSDEYIIGKVNDGKYVKFNNKALLIYKLVNEAEKNRKANFQDPQAIISTRQLVQMIPLAFTKMIQFISIWTVKKLKENDKLKLSTVNTMIELNNHNKLPDHCYKLFASDAFLVDAAKTLGAGKDNGDAFSMLLKESMLLQRLDQKGLDDFVSECDKFNKALEKEKTKAAKKGLPMPDKNPRTYTIIDINDESAFDKFI